MSPAASLVFPVAAIPLALAGDIAGPLLMQLVRASIEGALFAGAVWLICRLVPRLPASARSFLWWAACLKLVVGLVWVAPLPLPLLPAGLELSSPLARRAGLATAGRSDAGDPGARPLDRSTVEAALRTARRAPADGLRSSSDRGPLANGLGSPSHRSAGTTLGSPPSHSPAAKGRGSSSGVGSPAPQQSWAGSLLDAVARAAGRLPLVAVLAALWAGGVLAGLASLTAQLGRARRVRRGSAEIAEPLVAALFAGLCRDMGLRRRPELLASEEVGTPQALGLRHPAVVLPRADLARLSSEELEMALCHELVHLRRRDLWLGWVPALAERLFFFHPLAALAAREYALAREAACDAEVLRVLGAAPRDYGRLLVRLGAIHRPAPAFALGAAPALATLKRRLEMLQHSSETPRRRPVWLWLAALIALAALPSFRLVALNGPEEPAARAGAATPVARPAVALSVAGRDGTPVAGVTSAEGATAPAAAAPVAVAGPAAASASASIVDTAVATANARAALTAAGSALAALAGVAPLEASPASRAGAAAPPAPTPPPPPPPPEPPARAGGSAEESSYWTWSDDDDRSAAYVLRLGESNFMHGTVLDSARAKALGGGDVLWFRRGGKEYAIRDAAILAAAKELVRPSMELGKRQGELGSRQGELGSQQAKLGSKQAELGSRQAELGMRQAQIAIAETRRDREEGKADDLEQQQRELGRQQDELGRQQEELGRQQGALGEKQAALGEKQAELGRQQAEASRKVEAGLARLIDDAMKRGLAQEVKR